MLKQSIKMPICNDNQKKMTNETKNKNKWQSESTTIFYRQEE